MLTLKAEHESTNDCECWARLKSGDPDALGQLYDAYIDRLFAAASWITDNRELAKDAVQEVFIEVWTYRASIGQIRNTHSYLVKVLRSIIVKKIKSKDLSLHYILENSLASSEENIEQMIISSDSENEKLTSLRRALGNLTSRQKLILKLRYYEGLSYKQIAEMLGMNHQSVNNLAFRTINSLRGQMFAELIVLGVIFSGLL